MPRCGYSGTQELEVSDDIQSYVVTLCNEHKTLYDQGRIEKDILLSIAKFQAQQNASAVKNNQLTSREEYLSAICGRLKDFKGQLYISYAGPLPFHPDWYHDIRDFATNHPNMDQLVKALLKEKKEGADYDIKIIFRNSSRYLEKVRELTPPLLMQRLRDDVLQMIDELLDHRTAPEFCCSEFSKVHIPTIFEDAAISAVRELPNSPIDSGFQTFDQNTIDWEKKSFTRIFDSSHRGKHTELSDLKNFIKTTLR